MSILKFVVCKETASMCLAVAGVPWIERAQASFPSVQHQEGVLHP